MKAVKIIVLLLLFAIVLTFAYQNLEKVDVTFISWSITVPFSLTFFFIFYHWCCIRWFGDLFINQKEKR
jgi:uncharacterized integral membrane protein